MMCRILITPIEGFEYSVNIHPPVSGISLDPTCNEPPLRAALIGNGHFKSPISAFNIANYYGVFVGEEVAIAVDVQTNPDNSLPMGDFSFDFPAANFTFASTSIEYFFINDKDACASFKARWLVNRGGFEYETLA